MRPFLFRTTKNYGDDKVAGKNFLEKIIQVPIFLPQISRESLEEFCFKEVKQLLKSFNVNLNEDEWLRFTDNFKSGLLIRFQTMRIIKRYINAMIFTFPLIKNEVNTVDFLLLEGMSIIYPKLYMDIRENPLDYLSIISSRKNTSEYNQSESNRLTEKWYTFTNDAKSVKKLLFCLFPDVRSIFSGLRTDERIARMMGREDERLKADEQIARMMRREDEELIEREERREDKLQPKQRVCSEEYFRRFFEYKISDSDISDTEINKLFQQFTTDSFSKIISSFFEQGKADTLLLKIMNRLEDLSTKETEEIAITLSEIGSKHLLNKEQKSIRLTPIRSLAWESRNLVYHLVLEFSDLGERFNLFQKIIEKGYLIPFTVDFFKYSLLDEMHKFSDEQKNKLGQILANRIVNYFEDKSIFDYDEHFEVLIEILLDFGVRKKIIGCLKRRSMLSLKKQRNFFNVLVELDHLVVISMRLTIFLILSLCLMYSVRSMT